MRRLLSLLLMRIAIAICNIREYGFKTNESQKHLHTLSNSNIQGNVDDKAHCYDYFLSKVKRNNRQCEILQGYIASLLVP